MKLRARPNPKADCNPQPPTSRSRKMATRARLSRHRMGVLKARQLKSSKVYGVNCSAARFSLPPMLCCSLSPLQLYSFALKYRTSCAQTQGMRRSKTA